MTEKINDSFWVVIKKEKNFYLVERWEAGEDRILFLEKKRCITFWGSKRYAKRIVLDYIAKQYIKEKI